jgi:hypothetical protein
MPPTLCEGSVVGSRTMSPPTLDAVPQAHRQFPGDYCAESALEFASKIYGLTPLDQFPLQSDPQNQRKGFDEKVLQDLVLLTGHSGHHDIQSAVDTTEKETNDGKCASVSLRTYIVFDPITIAFGSHIFVAVLKAGQPILCDPASRLALLQGKAKLTTVLSQETDFNPEKTIHLEVLSPK